MSLFSFVLCTHQALYERTNGLLGHRLLGVATLLLRTTGRRSGQPRTSALNYVEDRGRYIVVGSNGGAPTPPAWLLNLQAGPKVEVQIARRRIPCTATVLGHDDPDFARLWRLADDRNSGRYAAYQRQTDRQIPVVALTPKFSGSGARPTRGRRPSRPHIRQVSPPGGGAAARPRSRTAPAHLRTAQP